MGSDKAYGRSCRNEEGNNYAIGDERFIVKGNTLGNHVVAASC